MLGPGDLILSSGAIENPYAEVLVEAALAGGYAGIALWPGAYHPRHRPGVDLLELKRRCEDAGVAIHDLDAMVVWAGPDDPGGPYYEEARDSDVLEMARLLEVDGINLLVHSDPPASMAQATEAFAAACDRAAELGLKVHLEFGRTRVPHDIPEAARVVTDAGSPNGGLMIDAWHVHWGPGSYEDLLGVEGARITGVQLCDAPAVDPENYGYATRHQRVAPGRGSAALTSLIRNLRAIGAPAPWCLEVFDTSRVERIGPVAWAKEMAKAARNVIADAENT